MYRDLRGALTWLAVAAPMTRGGGRQRRCYLDALEGSTIGPPPRRAGARGKVRSPAGGGPGPAIASRGEGNPPGLLAARRGGGTVQGDGPTLSAGGSCATVRVCQRRADPDGWASSAVSSPGIPRPEQPSPETAVGVGRLPDYGFQRFQPPMGEDGHELGPVLSDQV